MTVQSEILARTEVPSIATERAGERWHLSLRTWLLLIVTTITLLLVFRSGLLELLARFNEENYSHGILIPAVVAFLIWQKKAWLQSRAFEPSWWGVAAVFVALMGFFVGELGAQWTLVQYAFVGIILGLHLALMGWTSFRVVLAPLMILFLAIPLPYYIDIVLSGKLQLLSSRLGVDFIRFCNIPVFIEGNVIDLGLYKLQVVEACSGLRYLYPLMSIALICAYMFQAPFWKRALVFLSAAPITILMNSFRIATAGILVENFGVEMAEGFIHDFEGWIIFMVCMVLLLLEIRLLALFGGPRRSWQETFKLVADAPPTFGKAVNRTQPFPYPLLAAWLLILVSAGTIAHIDNREDIKPERRAFYLFPMALADQWRGTRSPLDQQALNVLGLTDYIHANYFDQGGEIVNLYIGYHESQRKGVTPHSPRACIPGGGWEIYRISNEDMQFQDGSSINYNRLIIRKGEERQLVYYWFHQRGRTIAKEYLMKWFLFFDAMGKNRTDGAMVRLITTLQYGEDDSLADHRLKEFASQIQPYLKDYIPD